MLPPKTKKTRALRRDSEWAFPHFGGQATSHWSVRSEILYFHFGVGCFLDSKREQLRSTPTQGNLVNENERPITRSKRQKLLPLV